MLYHLLSFRATLPFQVPRALSFCYLATTFYHPSILTSATAGGAQLSSLTVDALTPPPPPLLNPDMRAEMHGFGLDFRVL